jgi:protein-disulfide isomerase
VRPGKAKLDLKLWAILGPNSEAAHRAGYAAMQQNKLWLYATIVYLNQGDEQDTWFTDDFARAVAQAAGLDLQKFDADRKSDAADEMIAEVNAEATAQGFTGTPTIGVGKTGAQATWFDGVPTAADIQSAVAVR